MRNSQINRNELVALLSEADSSIHPQSMTGFGSPSSKPDPRHVWVCWEDESKQGETLPQLLIVADAEIEDFLAWAVTFLPKFRPFTAFIRVLPWTVFEMSQDRGPKPSNAIAPVIAGAALGEAMMSSTGRGFLETLPLTAFESTYSATLGRALFQGFQSPLMQCASEGWKLARQLTDQPMRRVTPESLDSVWAVVLALTDSTHAQGLSTPRLQAIYRGCTEIRDTGELSSGAWEGISQNRVSRSSYSEAMSATRERRVEFFETTVRSLINESTDELSTSFLVGYLASLISDGSIEHAQLVLPLQEILPTAMLWYGVNAGLLPRNRVLTDYGSLGLRLVREMNRQHTLLSAPFCDVSVRELEVLFRGDPRSRGFRQNNASLLRIEVAPTITTAVKWPPRTVSGGQLSLFGSEDRPVVSDLSRLHELVEFLRNGLSLAESMLPAQPEKRPPSESVRRTKRRR